MQKRVMKLLYGALITGAFLVVVFSLGGPCEDAKETTEDLLIAPLDTDVDGINDGIDNCLGVANADQADQDSDSKGDACDNCAAKPNADQKDSDSNGAGDACEPERDDDQDSIANSNDNCPTVVNVDQLDTDGDKVGDACDNCKDAQNADQEDSDNDSFGNACDSDDDNDGHADGSDNCPTVANANQADEDGDGLGDACEVSNKDPKTLFSAPKAGKIAFTKFFSSKQEFENAVQIDETIVITPENNPAVYYEHVSGASLSSSVTFYSPDATYINPGFDEVVVVDEDEIGGYNPTDDERGNYGAAILIEFKTPVYSLGIEPDDVDDPVTLALFDTNLKLIKVVVTKKIDYDDEYHQAIYFQSEDAFNYAAVIPTSQFDRISYMKLHLSYKKPDALVIQSIEPIPTISDANLSSLIKFLIHNYNEVVLGNTLTCANDGTIDTSRDGYHPATGYVDDRSELDGTGVELTASSCRLVNSEIGFDLTLHGKLVIFFISKPSYLVPLTTLEAEGEAEGADTHITFADGQSFTFEYLDGVIAYDKNTYDSMYPTKNYTISGHVNTEGFNDIR